MSSIVFLFVFQNALEHRPKEERIQLLSSKTAGATPLIAACRNGHYDVAEYLIKSCGADVELAGSGKKQFEILLFSLLKYEFGKLYDESMTTHLDTGVLDI